MHYYRDPIWIYKKNYKCTGVWNRTPSGGDLWLSAFCGYASPWRYWLSCFFFFQCEGISNYHVSTGLRLGSGTPHVIFNNKKVTFAHYQQSIINSLPHFKEDFNKNPEGFIFVFLKIGLNWCSKKKTIQLVTRVSKSHGALVYNYYQYSNQKYTPNDIIRAKKLCVSLGNSN